MNGVQEAADTLEALDPMPRFLLPLRNAEIDASGCVLGVVSATWCLEEAVSLLLGEFRTRFLS